MHHLARLADSFARLADLEPDPNGEVAHTLRHLVSAAARNDLKRFAAEGAELVRALDRALAGRIADALADRYRALRGLLNTLATALGTPKGYGLKILADLDGLA